jgi:hypothetical protein
MKPLDQISDEALIDRLRQAGRALPDAPAALQQRAIGLWVSPAADSFALAGQILGPDDAGSVQLAAQEAGGPTAHITHLDAMGEFRIEGVRSGTYVITLRLGPDEIVLPPLEIGGPSH